MDAVETDLRVAYGDGADASVFQRKVVTRSGADARPLDSGSRRAVQVDVGVVDGDVARAAVARADYRGIRDEALTGILRLWRIRVDVEARAVAVDVDGPRMPLIARANGSRLPTRICVDGAVTLDVDGAALVIAAPDAGCFGSSRCRDGTAAEFDVDGARLAVCASDACAFPVALRVDRQFAGALADLDGSALLAIAASDAGGTAFRAMLSAPIGGDVAARYGYRAGAAAFGAADARAAVVAAVCVDGAAVDPEVMGCSARAHAHRVAAAYACSVCATPRPYVAALDAHGVTFTVAAASDSGGTVRTVGLYGAAIDVNRACVIVVVRAYACTAVFVVTAMRLERAVRGAVAVNRRDNAR